MPHSDEQLRAVTIGEPVLHDGPIFLAEYDAGWPATFAAEAERIAGALSERALRVEHVGSTSVPGLAAKPIVDILLEVSDSSDEAAYVPALESAGYVLRIRELARRQWKYVQNYADAKSEVVEAILARAPGAVPREPHETPDAC